jgi:hypothetical protein
MISIEVPKAQTMQRASIVGPWCAMAAQPKLSIENGTKLKSLYTCPPVTLTLSPHDTISGILSYKAGRAALLLPNEEFAEVVLCDRIRIRMNHASAKQ